MRSREEDRGGVLSRLQNLSDAMVPKIISGRREGEEKKRRRWGARFTAMP